MESTLLCTIEWTPPFPLCYSLQLFLTVNSVNHGVGSLINSLQPTLYDWVDSTLPSVLRPTTIPYSEQCQPWCGLSLIHSNLLCTIEWTPPYPLCYALQLFLAANSVNHGGVGLLINALHPTLCDWVDSTLPPGPVLHALQLFFVTANTVNHGVGSLINALHPTLCDWVDSTLPPGPVLHALQLFFVTANSVNHGVGPLINALHPTLCDWVDSTLPPGPVLHALQLFFVTANTVNHGVGPLINALHPTLYDWGDSILLPCIAYSEQGQSWSGPSFEWTLRAIEWTPPYQLQCSAWCRLAKVCGHRCIHVAGWQGWGGCV